jgi:hypothetical protein
LCGKAPPAITKGSMPHKSVWARLIFYFEDAPGQPTCHESAPGG